MIMFIKLGFYEGAHRADDKIQVDKLNESCNQVDDSWFYEFHHESLKSSIMASFETYINWLGAVWQKIHFCFSLVSYAVDTAMCLQGA